MANIAASPFVLKNATLTIAADNYEASVSQVEFTPTQPTASWAGLTPASVYNSVGASTWVCTMSGAQDWATTNSLSNYLLTNEGNSVVAVFRPIAGGPGFSATVTLAAPQIGGTVNGVPVFTVALQVAGKPTKVAAV